MKYLLSAILLWSAMTMSLEAKSTRSFVGPTKGGTNAKQSKGVPYEINYQGWLESSTDTTEITDTLNMVFRLYNVATGGIALWNETQNNVNVDNGIFNVLLGSVIPISPNIFIGNPLWLETQVESDTLTPRKKLVSVGYAIKSVGADIAVYADTANYAWDANKLDGQDASAFALVGHTHSYVDSATYADTANYADTAGYAIINVPDNDWTILGNVLYPSENYGLAMRSSNELFGDSAHTHVNFGVDCTTGTSGGSYYYCTVSGGEGNAATKYYSAVGGGKSNTATGWYATVGSGKSNTASGSYAVVNGGENNTASQDHATVGGGKSNASSNSATVSGGEENTASGLGATIGGGKSDTASGSYATVSGGNSNIASEYSTTVGGGYKNTASSNYATVSGGEENIASGLGATVGGGKSDTASGSYATISGGEGNSASWNYATVGGGYQNTANNYYAIVGGGENNTASKDYTTVSGGKNNDASGNYATVGGGNSNTVSEYNATIGGGYENTASGNSATVGGGYQNIASSLAATVSGGQSNVASGYKATVGGGYGNTADGEYSFAAGEQVNLTSSASHTFGFGNNFTTSMAYCAVFYDPSATFKMGIGVANPNHPLHMKSGAYCSATGVWTDASSRDYKENIVEVSTEEAIETINKLKPVRFNYTVDEEDEYVGFIAEDVPELVATKDRKGMSAMDVVAVLTKVVQNQQNRIVKLEKKITELEK